jgi:hypothetical protein
MIVGNATPSLALFALIRWWETGEWVVEFYTEHRLIFGSR